MDLNKIKYLDELEKIGLSKKDYIIWGSAPLIIRGLKETSDDLDILIRKEVWNKLKEKYPTENRQVGNIENEFIVINNIDITYRVVGLWEEIDELFLKADQKNGYYIFSLEDTIIWKKGTGREKDLKDIEKISRYLSYK